MPVPTSAAWGAYREALGRIYESDVESLIATPEPTEVVAEEPIGDALRSSGQLTEAIGASLDHGSPEDRQLAIMQLAAAAEVDMGVAVDLARREEGVAREAAQLQGVMAAGREASLSFALPEAEPVLVAQALDQVPGVPGEGPPPPGGNVENLENAIEATIAKIRSDAAAGGQDVVAGLSVVGVPLGHALGAVAEGAIGALGKEVGRWVRKAVAFLGKAVEKLLRLLGTKVTDAIAGKLDELLKDLEEGDLLADVLKRAWGTDAIEADAKKAVTDPSASLSEEDVGAAVEKLERLQAAYGKQAGFVRKVLKAVKFVQGFVFHIQPAGPLILGAGYASALAFLTLSGADYVDWERADMDGFFDRVDGVRHIVAEAVA